MKTRTIGNRSHPFGLTLVELLVVLGITTLLAAVILPSVRTILADRKTSQAAIVVRNFIEAARSRAIGRNRTVAVVLERLSSRPADINQDGVINALDLKLDLSGVLMLQSSTSSVFDASTSTLQSPDLNFLAYNTCIQLSLAEEPSPVTEALIPSPLVIQARAVGDGLTPPIPPIFLDEDQLNANTKGKVNRPEVRIFTVTPVPPLNPPAVRIADYLAEYLVSGNQIALGDSSRFFTIVAPPNSQYNNSIPVDPDPNKPTPIWFSVSNEIGIDGASEMALRPYVDLSVGQTWGKFTILQKPRPIYSESIQLPKGTCIDLSLSGFANTVLPSEVSTALAASVPSRLPVYEPLAMHAAAVSSATATGSSVSDTFDYRARFASDWSKSGVDGVPIANELRPIYIVFGPDGALNRVYANARRGAENVPIDPVDDIFLHIGRVDQVTMGDVSVSDPIFPGRSRASIESTAATTRSNLRDLSSYIIRLSPRSGSISAAPIRDYAFQETVAGLAPGAGTLGDCIQFSRQGTYGSSLTAQ